MEQLCWNCKNTNRYKCSWFEVKGELPEYVEIKNGFIVKCEKYKPIIPDENRLKPTNKEIADILNISVRTFYRNKKKFMKKYQEICNPPLP